jgi:hypothetical protein
MARAQLDVPAAHDAVDRQPVVVELEHRFPMRVPSAGDGAGVTRRDASRGRL